MSSQERLHALDAVRGFALLLGVLLNASMSFFLPIPALDVSQSDALASMTYVIHTFRMPVFYLLAGFFGHMAFHRKGARSFVGDRAKRIGVPLLVGWVILIPITTAVTIWGLTRTFGGEALAGAASTEFALRGDRQSQPHPGARALRRAGTGMGEARVHGGVYDGDLVLDVRLDRCGTARASAVRRYIADSSYWLYLVHLPVVFCLQVVFAQVPWHWTVKYLLILAIAFTVLFASYHYLVRSTFIGRVLNGRKYRRVPLKKFFRPDVTIAPEGTPVLR